MSILTKIFLGFAAVIAAFGGLAGYSELQNLRAVSTLRLVVENYVDTAQTINDIGATQGVTRAVLSGVLDERGVVARSWLNTARRVRPGSLRGARASVARIRDLDLPAGERAYFGRVERELGRIAREYAEDERRFDELFALLDGRQMERARVALRELERRELNLEQRLNRLEKGIENRVRSLSERVDADQRQSRANLVGLVAMALAVALAVWIVVFRTLSPIRRMRETAAAVAQGDLAQRVDIRRSDELGRLAEEFDRMTDALVARDERLREQAKDLIQAERLATIGKMAAHITHEVRNPLSSIGLNTELLQEEIARLAERGDGAEAMALIDSIGREIDRLTAITEEYLRFARLPDPRRQPEDLAEIVRSVVDFVRPEVEGAGLTLELTVRGRPPLVSVDEAQIRQALMNLIRNAREATPTGGTVVVDLAGEAESAVLSVRDSGPGIQPELAGQIFDAFFTTKEHGTGLGLPLVKQIVVAHGGTIDCLSEGGRGATFRLSLPASPTAAAADGEPPLLPVTHPSSEGAQGAT